MQIRLNFNPRHKSNRVEMATLREMNLRNTAVPISKGRRLASSSASETRDCPRSYPEAQRNTNWNRVEKLLQEFDQLVGLHEIKQTLKEIAAYVVIQRQRQQEGLLSEPMTLHMVFKGSPGTGKTTVARLVGKLFRELNVLSKGHLVEVDRADLVGEYIGHTAQKTREQLKKASGGILFIDEAYSLGRGGERDFGKEATDILVKYLEDWREDLIVILAGYTHEMDMFMASNPGLRSRFPLQLEFPDYSIVELMEIAKLMLDQRQYCLEDDAWDELEKILKKALLQGQIKTGNARLVRNVLEKAIRRQALRLVKEPRVKKEELMKIKKCDLTGDAYPNLDILAQEKKVASVDLVKER